MSKPDLSTYGGRLHEIGYNGQLANLNPVTLFSLINDRHQAIEFGAAVARSDTDKTCKAPMDDKNLIIGIAARHAIFPASAARDNAIMYGQGDAVPILKEGYIYALTADDTQPGDAVVCILFLSGRLGSKRHHQDSELGRPLVPGATWESSTAKGQIGLIRIVS